MSLSTHIHRRDWRVAGPLIGLGALLILIGLLQGCGGKAIPNALPVSRVSPDDIEVALLRGTGMMLPKELKTYYSTAWKTVEPAQASRIWWESKISSRTYPAFRCGQISSLFYAHALQEANRQGADTWWAIGICGKDGHAMNCFIDGNKKLWMLEPQTGEIWPATRDDKIVRMTW